MFSVLAPFGGRPLLLAVPVLGSLGAFGTLGSLIFLVLRVFWGPSAPAGSPTSFLVSNSKVFSFNGEPGTSTFSVVFGGISVVFTLGGLPRFLIVAFLGDFFCSTGSPSTLTFLGLPRFLIVVFLGISFSTGSPTSFLDSISKVFS